MKDTIYEVKTNLPPEAVTEIALAIFAEWVSFAMGETSIGGKRIAYPTGRYAASLQYRQEGVATVAIIANPVIAPEAAILETGHDRVDLKKRLTMGKAYAMHRPVGENPFGLKRIGSGPPTLKSSLWAAIRGREASGYPSFGPNSDPNSWVIPAMPAYSPAFVLSQQAKLMAGS
jgi:hypothetical protein